MRSPHEGNCGGGGEELLKMLLCGTAGNEESLFDDKPSETMCNEYKRTIVLNSYPKSQCMYSQNTP